MTEPTAPYLVARAKDHHDPEATTLWMVFLQSGKPYFTTSYDLRPELHHWRGSYIVKEVRIHPIDGKDVRLEVVQ